MKYLFQVFLLLFLISCIQQKEQAVEIKIQGLTESVEVIRDESGINHIYAQNQNDLFFAQGYLAAKDRLFQFEIWRRQATGTVAEILGESELKRDIGTRLFKFRGDMTEEMNYYHEDGVEIITQYTAGVNAYIDEVLQNLELLPVTFKALGILPQKWTPEVVISRHQGLLGNIGTELATGIAVANLGAEQVKKYSWFHPKDPKLALDPAIDGSLLKPEILELYNAYRTSVNFQPEDILPDYRTELTEQSIGMNFPQEFESQDLWIGSNNWVTRPELAANGHAYMANDPHRRLAVPSLRYWAHLNAPGWNVIGGGEPEIPGISIGHNDHGAWGLTVFRTDGEDLYVYDLNPENLQQYRFQDAWKEMTVITERIPVKGDGDHEVDLWYTHHGPVTYIDSANFKAYAVKCAWMEPGGSPYLASLRMDQAKTWEEFRTACNYSHIPGENMIWADQSGNIGWQAVGIAPIRRNFSGMVPVPGDGRYEWDDYLPIVQKPNVYNPPSGYFATANENVTPESYDEWDAIGFQWADPFRGDRIAEVLEGGKKLTMEDMKALQTDYLSLPARQLLPLLFDLEVAPGEVEDAQLMLSDWDFRLDPASAEAAIYVAWENELRENFYHYFPNDEVQQHIPAIQFSRILSWIFDPNSFIADRRDEYLANTFEHAVNWLMQQQGEDMRQWRYGDASFKHVTIRHPLGTVVNTALQKQLNTDIIERGGNQYTPGATGSNFNQTHGATFRIIVDVNDWDASVGMNSPGQSGDPNSPYYKNLYKKWAADEFFPVHFSREKVEANAQQKVRLVPE
ncbi:MAG: penicillin acylase family protein [Cytophagales bacterium]|nr:penicillin acylase family protein [Cytophagales bacterium]